jgi:hypothetical protein
VNGDGKPDLVTANGHPANTVSVLLNLGDGSFRAKLDYPTISSAVLASRSTSPSKEIDLLDT